MVPEESSMATAPHLRTSDAATAETLEERFRRLSAAWQQAVAYHSSTSIRNNHPAYQDIIGLGPPVVPLLLRDMEANSTHWFAALRQITGADPIPESAAGRIPEMVAAWLRWARDNGYRW
jgi:hypothetical protein